MNAHDELDVITKWTSDIKF